MLFKLISTKLASFYRKSGQTLSFIILYTYYVQNEWPFPQQLDCREDKNVLVWFALAVNWIPWRIVRNKK